jgi:hypothetical protein
MVPCAVYAHLDQVAGEAVVGSGQLRQPVSRIDDPAAVPLELISVDVSDPSKRIMRADWARTRYLVADVLGRTEQLGMSITDV